MPKDNTPLIHNSLLVVRVGPLAMWLKDRYILPIVSAAGALATVLLSTLAVDATGKPLPFVVLWVVISACLIALSTILDTIADRYDKILADMKLTISEDAAAVKVADLIKFIQKCALVSTKKNTARRVYIDVLPQFLVSAAASSFSGGTRATYYNLKGANGNRILGDPVHELQGGRMDQSETPFLEAESKENTIWRLLDRADTEPEIVEEPNDCDGVNWAKVKYKTYYTVPVKCGNRTYGILSVNSDVKGSISGSQQRAILGMARAYALTRSLAESSSN